MKIIFVNHSCFLAELADTILIFDFWRLPWQKNRDFSPEEYLDKGKKLFVFASHGHEDHYSPHIFDWDNGKRDVTYILSDDIAVPQLKTNRISVGENREIVLEPIRVRTFGSTDLGVSFWIRTEEASLFHAGDLNWWHWDEETPDERKYAEDFFKGIMRNIVEYGKKEQIKPDVAFFPVDGRLGYAAFWAGEYFIREMSPKIFFPMHFWKKFSLTEAFADHEKTLNAGTNCIVIHHNIEEFNIQI